MPEGKKTTTEKPISSKQRPFQGLQITSTPIGNLEDLSDRAKNALTMADIVACEDTRHTGLLLARLGIKAKKLIAYHDHSPVKVMENLISAMQNGQTVTLVCDAGTPLIADPGYKLVAACRNHGIAVTSIPGASALLSGLAASGLPTDSFYFGGFLPNSLNKRREVLFNILSCTVVFYESPKRLSSTLGILAEYCPSRHCVIARELTKIHETFYIGNVLELYHELKDKSLKGEVVLMLGTIEAEMLKEEDITAMLIRCFDDGLSRRDAAKLVASETNWPKNKAYTLALSLVHPNDNTL